MVQLDDRWKDANIDLIKKRENVNLLRGYVKSFESKGYRLREVFRMIQSQLKDELVQVIDNPNKKEKHITNHNLEKRLMEAGDNLI